MPIQLIDSLMAVGVVLAAIAVGGLCLVGLVVWMGGWNWKTPKRAK